ncbi:MAG: fused MFS/spermidine synthase [Patescibacteria group bacterium]
MNKNKLLIIVFVCGAVVMVLELTGSRILAPYVGTSLPVWSALMGVILGALSLGYYFGGRLADKEPNLNVLARIILLSAVNIMVLGLIKNPVTALAANSGVVWGSITACLILFAPPSMLLGMVSPYTIKLKLENIHQTGNVAGNLYAFSTLGSIFGTFLAGLGLIPYIKITNIVFGMSAVLFVLFLFIVDFKIAKKNLYFGLLFLLWPGMVFMEQNSNYIVDGNTAYSAIKVYDYVDIGNHIVRGLDLNQEFSSAIYLDSDEMVYEYSKYYRLDNVFTPKIDSALLLGGGAYTLAKDFLQRNEAGKIDVVEIDPVVTDIAKKYFNLQDDPRLKSYNEDARTFVNRATQKYDAVYVDVFRSRFYVPWHVTTKETFTNINRILNDSGVVIINANNSLSGKGSKFVWSEYKTLQSIFPQVFVFGINKEHPEAMQNVIIVAVKSSQIFNTSIQKKFSNFEAAKYLDNLYNPLPEDLDSAIILTDDYAPVDYFNLETI